MMWNFLIFIGALLVVPVVIVLLLAFVVNFGTKLSGGPDKSDDTVADQAKPAVKASQPRRKLPKGLTNLAVLVVVVIIVPPALMTAVKLSTSYGAWLFDWDSVPLQHLATGDNSVGSDLSVSPAAALYADQPGFTVPEQFDGKSIKRGVLYSLVLGPGDSVMLPMNHPRDVSWALSWDALSRDIVREEALAPFGEGPPTRGWKRINPEGYLRWSFDDAPQGSAIWWRYTNTAAYHIGAPFVYGDNALLKKADRLRREQVRRQPGKGFATLESVLAEDLPRVFLK